MKKEFYICDECKDVIEESTSNLTEDYCVPDSVKGYIIKGNINVASVEFGGGLIGNNFPILKGEPQITGISLNDIKETVLCTSCFCEALHLNSSEVKK